MDCPIGVLDRKILSANGQPIRGLITAYFHSGKDRGKRAMLDFTNAMGRGKSADNPMVLGPAGTMNATLEAHAQLALEFLKDDSPLIPVSMREKLFTPHPNADSGYAMGWGIRDDPKLGRLYLHSGSNTMWTSQIIIAPDVDRVVIVNANQFNDQAQAAIRDVVNAALEDTQ